MAAPGFVLSEVFLLALWLALGGQHWLARLIVVTAPALNLGHAINFHVPDLSLWENSLLVAGVSLTAVLCFHALLLPLRWFGGFRLGFVPLPLGDSSGGRQQLLIRHLLAWMVWCSLPCALCRAIAPDFVFEMLATIGLLGAFNTSSSHKSLS